MRQYSMNVHQYIWEVKLNTDDRIIILRITESSAYTIWQLILETVVQHNANHYSRYLHGMSLPIMVVTHVRIIEIRHPSLAATVTLH